MVDESLARSFEGIGSEYERYRPGFPVGAVELLAPDRVGTILDLGAGTGKFTELLIGRADRVVAVEPSTAMLDVLHAKLPEVTALSGTAARIPLEDGAADAVSVAQAFHWFDRERACAEITRVLAPGGAMALIWNRADPACAWDRSCHRIVHPAVSASDDTTRAAAEELPGFRFVRHEELAWREAISRDDYIGRWTTVSSFLVADAPRRAKMLADVHHVLDEHVDTAGRREFDLPHLTDVYLYRRA